MLPYQVHQFMGRAREPPMDNVHPPWYMLTMGGVTLLKIAIVSLARLTWLT